MKNPIDNGMEDIRSDTAIPDIDDPDPTLDDNYRSLYTHSIEANRYTYDFSNSTFFDVYDSLQKHWRFSEVYPSILRSKARLLKPVNLHVSQSSPIEVLRLLFDTQPLIKYAYDADINNLTMFTDSIQYFLDAK